MTSADQRHYQEQAYDFAKNVLATRLGAIFMDLTDLGNIRYRAVFGNQTPLFSIEFSTLDCFWIAGEVKLLLTPDNVNDLFPFSPWSSKEQ